MATISQREARRLQKRVAELERMENSRRATWQNDYPGGTHIGTVTTSEAVKVNIARRLHHAVVVVDNGSELRLYALPWPQA